MTNSLACLFFLSPAETDEIQDFDYSDSDSYDSNISDLDENLLLSENEELETKQNSQNHQDGKDDITNYGNFSPYVDYSNVPLGHKKEEQDDLISLHPDESLFDEEDEFSTNNNRFVRPRLVFLPVLKLVSFCGQFLSLEVFCYAG